MSGRGYPLYVLPFRGLCVKVPISASGVVTMEKRAQLSDANPTPPPSKEKKKKCKGTSFK
jgi:hypothetical protein